MKPSEMRFCGQRYSLMAGLEGVAALSPDTALSNTLDLIAGEPN